MTEIAGAVAKEQEQVGGSRDFRKGLRSNDEVHREGERLAILF